MRNKLPAFTIVEVTITMLITAVVVGLALTIYVIINKSYQTFISKNQGITEITELDHIISRDFERCEIILKDTDGIKLTGGSLMSPVKYSFQTDYVIRKSVKNDTFKVGCDSATTFFESKPVTGSDTSAEQNRLDQLVIELLFAKERIDYRYFKLYSSANLLNRVSHAVH